KGPLAQFKRDQLGRKRPVLWDGWPEPAVQSAQRRCDSISAVGRKRPNHPRIDYTYERKIAERFGGQQELELIATAKEPVSRDSAGPLFDQFETKEAAT
ncbi:MAG: hypothetical protein KGQ47_08825, partial [Hyphomicrobiales bacterium]|nr:hypothetical protein [Hyphomicrobiales bacterium]